MNQAIQYGPWTGGVDYSRPAVDLPPESLTSMSDTEILDSGAVTDRGGYDEHIATAITGTPSQRLPPGCLPLREPASGKTTQGHGQIEVARSRLRQTSIG